MKALVNQLKSYCENSTIHGPSYLTLENAAKRLAWGAAMLVCSYFATDLIWDSFLDWTDGLVVTTMGDNSVPVQDIQVETRLKSFGCK